MPRLVLPNSVSFHTARSFLAQNDPFHSEPPGKAVLELHPNWLHLEPLGLAMAAAWGSHHRRLGQQVEILNLGARARYAARMGLFDFLGIDFSPAVQEHEEAGRFLSLTQVQSNEEVRDVIGDISALLHLDGDPESLAAVQYCISELLRNVLEHSGSPDGAFVCAHRYHKADIPRVTIAVADCGIGIPAHLGRVHPEAAQNDLAALGLAMRPGVTGAMAGAYGTPDNAGAGLFITRCMAKGTGGYFLLISNSAAYRLRRESGDDEMTALYADPFDEPRIDRWAGFGDWQGTVVSVEIRTDKIADYTGFFQWIFGRIPRKTSKDHKIRFT